MGCLAVRPSLLTHILIDLYSRAKIRGIVLLALGHRFRVT